MKSLFSAGILIFSVILLAAVTGLFAAELEQSKNRRGGGGTAGLFAFPRVGRGDPNQSFSARAAGDVGYERLFPNSYEEYEEYPKMAEVKRANLIAFPRVGRSDIQLWKLARLAAQKQAFDKLIGPNIASDDFWYGLQNGKILNRNDNDARHKNEEHY